MANFYSGSLIGSNQVSTDPTLHGQMDQVRQSIMDQQSVISGLQSALTEMAPDAQLETVFADVSTRRSRPTMFNPDEPD